MKVRIEVARSCSLCGLCVKYCPTNVFSIKGGELEVSEDRCIYCRGCEVLCPEKALRVEMLDEGLEIEVHRAL